METYKILLELSILVITSKFFGTTTKKIGAPQVAGEIIAGLAGKIPGCGFMARILGFSRRESLQIGFGMMTRGEVALIVAQKGLDAGLVDPKYFTSVI